MALSDKQISQMWSEAHNDTSDRMAYQVLARAIEAEVRKQDDALIQQLADALDECKDSTQERIDTLTESGIDKHKPRYFRSYVQDLQRAADAISAARVRLESKP